MRSKTLLVLILLFSTTFKGMSQEVFPTFADSAKWNVLLCVYGIGYSCNTLNFQYEYDTLFCGHVYSKVKLNGTSGAIGYIRADSIRAYCRVSNLCSDKEYLLYDYSGNEGDTLYIGFNLWHSTSEDTIPFTINNIDTVNFNGKDRRVFHMQYFPEPIVWPGLYRLMDWVEGVGATSHPFYSLDCIEDYCESSWRLLCYDSLGMNLYKDSTFNTCDTSYTDAVINEIANKNKLNIFPNPFENTLTISTESGTIIGIDIFNLIGERILIISGNNRNNITIERLNNLNAGIYLIKVQTDKGFITRRIIKVK